MIVFEKLGTHLRVDVDILGPEELANSGITAEVVDKWPRLEEDGDGVIFPALGYVEIPIDLVELTKSEKMVISGSKFKDLQTMFVIVRVYKKQEK
jgi:hypothetical protein